MEEREIGELNVHLKEILIVVGAGLTILLTVNAYFFKEFTDSMNQVQVQTAILIEQNINAKEKLKELDSLKSRIIILETRYKYKK